MYNPSVYGTHAVERDCGSSYRLVGGCSPKEHKEICANIRRCAAQKIDVERQLADISRKRGTKISKSQRIEEILEEGKRLATMFEVAAIIKAAQPEQDLIDAANDADTEREIYEERQAVLEPIRRIENVLCETTGERIAVNLRTPIVEFRRKQSVHPAYFKRKGKTVSGTLVQRDGECSFKATGVNASVLVEA